MAPSDERMSPRRLRRSFDSMRAICIGVLIANSAMRTLFKLTLVLTSSSLPSSLIVPVVSPNTSPDSSLRSVFLRTSAPVLSPTVIMEASSLRSPATSSFTEPLPVMLSIRGLVSDTALPFFSILTDASEVAK